MLCVTKPGRFWDTAIVVWTDFDWLNECVLRVASNHESINKQNKLLWSFNGLSTYLVLVSFRICCLIAVVARWVLGMRSRSWWVSTTSPSSPSWPNLNVMMSGCFFFAVILMMERRELVCLTLAQPGRSDISLSMTNSSAMMTKWLGRKTVNLTSKAHWGS